MAAKKNDNAGRMQFMIDYMKSHPSAAYADVHSAAKAKGYEIFPIMYGRVQKLLGRVGKSPGKAASAAAPKRRGRPPGSKNKPKAAAAAAAPKRRGRPPGSKNKPKAAAVAAPAPVMGRAIALTVDEADMAAWRQLVGGANAGKTLALQFDGSRWVVLFT